MNALFADTLRKLRTEKGLSQKQLSKQMMVSEAAISRWENGSRLPDAAMIARLARVLEVDVSTLLYTADVSEKSPNIIMVDDSKSFLYDSLAVLEEVLPNATIAGFIWAKEAVEFARANRVALAILDIELGTDSGLDLCRTLLEIHPRTNVVYLTAYPDYSLDAWDTDACGFMVKPLTPEGVRRQLHKLRYPFLLGGAGA